MKIIYLLFMGYLLLESIPIYIKASFIKKYAKVDCSEEVAYKKISATAKRFLKFASIPIELIGEENIPKNKGVIFICNHQGYYDIPILLGTFNSNVTYIAKQELKSVPILSGWMKKINCIFINRENARQAYREMEKATKLLNRGISVVIFPEGIVSRGSKLGNFKSGAFRFAIKNKATVIPITISGKYSDEEKECWLRPENVKIMVSKPISTDGFDIKQHKSFAEEVKKIILYNLE